MILVTTTGKVGSEASRLLAKRGVPVRVLAHHPAQERSPPDSTRVTRLPGQSGNGAMLAILVTTPDSY